MTDPNEQERVGGTQDLRCEKVKVNRTGMEKDSYDYNRPTGEDKFTLWTQNEKSGIEKTQLEEMRPTEDISPVQMSTVRTKKLKTDIEDPASEIRKRNKTRTTNAHK